ncbi:MAG TPA: TolC family protein [Gemmatimonadales bacterium]
MPAVGQGQVLPDDRLTLADAAERALAGHPSVRAIQASSDQAHSAAAAASAAWLPSITLTASAMHHDQPMLVTPIHGLTPGETLPFERTLVQGAATMSYSLFDGGARRARILHAHARADAADAVVDESEQLLVARVATAYLQVLTRHQVLDAHDRRRAALEAELSRARQRYDVGRAPQLEVLRVEAALASARAERVRLAEALDLSEREVGRLTGAAEDDTRAGRLVPVHLADSLLPPRAELLRRARSASPTMARAEREVAAADAGVAVAEGARWPELRLNATYYQRGSVDTRSWGEWSAGTLLSFPLFTGGAASAEVARTRAGRRAAEEQLHLAELELEREVDRARSAVEEARARKASLESAAATLVEVTRIEKLSLDAGSGTQTDYLAAEANLLAARASLVEATMTELTAWTELARVTGELSVPWLRRVMEAKR